MDYNEYTDNLNEVYETYRAELVFETKEGKYFTLGKVFDTPEQAREWVDEYLELIKI